MLSHARWTCRTSTEALKSCNATHPGLDRKGSQPLELLTLSREESFGLLVQPPGVFRYVLFSGLGPGLPRRSMVFSQHGVSRKRRKQHEHILCQLCCRIFSDLASTRSSSLRGPQDINTSPFIVSFAEIQPDTWLGFTWLACARRGQTPARCLSFFFSLQV